MFSRISKLVRQLVRNLLEGLKVLEDEDVVTCIFIENEVNVAKLLCKVFVVFSFGVFVVSETFDVESRLVVVLFLSTPTMRM